MLWLALCAVALTAAGQVPGSALDHMLQRPRVSKTYKDKTLFDHLFVDAGLGISAMGPGGITTNGLGELNIGDWFTPEHGMRLHFDGGIFKPDGFRTKYVGGGLEYLLNLTALSQYGNDYQPRTFELYGIAGLGYHYSRQEGVSARGLDVHIGLRGQAALSPFTYLYIEPPRRDYGRRRGSGCNLAWLPPRGFALGWFGLSTAPASPQLYRRQGACGLG